VALPPGSGAGHGHGHALVLQIGHRGAPGGLRQTPVAASIQAQILERLAPGPAGGPAPIPGRPPHHGPELSKCTKQGSNGANAPLPHPRVSGIRWECLSVCGQNGYI